MATTVTVVGDPTTRFVLTEARDTDACALAVEQAVYDYATLIGYDDEWYGDARENRRAFGVRGPLTAEDFSYTPDWAALAARLGANDWRLLGTMYGAIVTIYDHVDSETVDVGFYLSERAYESLWRFATSTD